MSLMHPFDDSPVRSWTLADVAAAVRRRARVAIVASSALSAGALAAVITAPAIYEGDFKILVKRDRADAVVSGAHAEALRPELLSEQELLSEVELLKATDLLERVATEAGLVARALAANDADTDAEALAKATKTLDRDLSVEPLKKTWLIDVSYRDKDPQTTRSVLDTLVRLYLEKHLRLQRLPGTYEFFSAQAERARQELETAQARLTAFTETNGVVSADLEKQAVLQKLAEFDAMRAEAAAALAEATQRLAAIDTQMAEVPAQRTSEVKIMENSGVGQDIQDRILTLEMKRTELLQRFTPEYRGIAEIDQQLADAREALAAALSTPIREETVAANPTRQWLDTEHVRVRTEHAALRARVRALTGAVQVYRTQAQALDVHGAEQGDLLRAVSAAEERYRLYASKQEEARISDELDRTRMANVVVAQAPSVRFEPHRRPSLAMLPLLLLVSWILGLGLALVVDGLSGAPGAPAGGRHAEVGVGPVPPLVPSPPSPSLETVMRRTVANTASLTARLETMKALTREVEAQWSAPETAARPVPPAEKTVWTVMPGRGGLRQEA